MAERKRNKTLKYRMTITQSRLIRLTRSSGDDKKRKVYRKVERKKIIKNKLESQ